MRGGKRGEGKTVKLSRGAREGRRNRKDNIKGLSYNVEMMRERERERERERVRKTECEKGRKGLTQWEQTVIYPELDQSGFRFHLLLWLRLEGKG